MGQTERNIYQSQIDTIRNETNKNANTRSRVADAFNALSDTKAETDGTNIEVEKFKKALGIDNSAQNGNNTSDITKADVTKMLENITVGGNNLLLNTALPQFTPNSTGKGTPVVMSDSTGYFIRITPDAGHAVSVYGQFLANSHLGNHSMGMDFRHAHTSNITIWGQSVPPNTWTRLKREHFTNDNGWSGFNASAIGVAVDVRNYKIELGSKATDWRPHIDELVAITSPHQIDGVFAENENGVGFSRDSADVNIVLVAGIPYAQDIAVILDFYFIYTDGTAEKGTANADGKGNIRFDARTLKKALKKFYLKALIK